MHDLCYQNGIRQRHDVIPRFHHVLHEVMSLVNQYIIFMHHENIFIQELCEVAAPRTQHVHPCVMYIQIQTTYISDIFTLYLFTIHG